MLRADVVVQAVRRKRKQVAASVVKPDSVGDRSLSQPHCEMDFGMSCPHCQASSMVLQTCFPFWLSACIITSALSMPYCN